jgi:hypothetical protein
MPVDADPGPTKLDRPVGICPRCRAVATSYDQIGRKCGSPQPFGAKCPGIIRSALARDEWTECLSCGATGQVEKGVCRQCNGAGWIYGRR